MNIDQYIKQVPPEIYPPWHIQYMLEMWKTTPYSAQYLAVESSGSSTRDVRDKTLQYRRMIWTEHENIIANTDKMECLTSPYKYVREYRIYLEKSNEE